MVVETARDLIENGRLQDALQTSAVRAFAGLGLGTAIGTLLALVSGLSRVGEAVIDGPIQVKRAIPTLALLPLLVLWLGITEEMKIITIALAVMLPVYIHTHNGLRTIDGRYAELAETVDIGRAGVHPERPAAGSDAGLPARHAVRGHHRAAVAGRGRADQRDQRHRLHDPSSRPATGRPRSSWSGSSSTPCWG